jgi:hypothetical protein
MNSANTLSFAHLAIPILALLIPIVAIAAHYLGKAHSERQRHETIRELARAGQPIPPELLAGVQDSDWQRAQRVKTSPNSMLLPAAVNVGLGLGLMGMFVAINPASWLWSIGLVPLCLGLGLGVVWAISRQQKPEQPGP